MIWEKGGYDENGGNGFIKPSIFFEQVSDDQANTENRHEKRNGYDLSMLMNQVLCEIINLCHFLRRIVCFYYRMQSQDKQNAVCESERETERKEL
jgi:hypothetical protein